MEAKPTPPAITRRWCCEFRGIPAPRSMRHTVGDGSPHAVEPIHQFAVVVIPVPKVEDQQNNQRGHEYAHLTSPFRPGPSATGKTGLGLAKFVLSKLPAAFLFR